MATETSVQVMLRTSIYRGDHAAEVTIPQELLPGEWVEEMARRLLGRKSGEEKYADWIEIRLVQPAKREGDAR